MQGKIWSNKKMSLKGSYFASGLACQNLGDCSLCGMPIIPETQPEQKSKKENKSKKTISVRELLNKFKSDDAA